jgi:hypothetical protein
MAYLHLGAGVRNDTHEKVDSTPGRATRASVLRAARLANIPVIFWRIFL